MRKIVFVLLLSVFWNGLDGFSQILKVDSLKAIYLVSNDAKVKLITAEQLAKEYLKQKEYDSLARYDLLALKQSYKINDTLQMIRYSSEVGFDFTGKGDFQKALKYHKQALDLYYKYTADTSNLKNLDPYKFPLMTNNLGVAYAKLGVFDSAIHYIFKSVEEKQKLHVEESKLMSSWNNLATLAFRKKEYSLALEFANKCLETANREQDTVYMSHSYNILGVVYKYLKDYDQSISFYLKSLELSKSTGSKKNIGNVLGNLGILYLDLGDSTNAKRYIKEALKYSRYIQDKSVLANTQSKMAFFYYDYMQYDSAILMAKKSLEFASKTGYSIMEELNYKVLHQSYSKIGQFDSAYLSAVLYMQNHDSIYESESDKNYQELQTKYQTAEKEKEILELKYSAEIEKLHQLRMYWIGGSLIGIAGFFILLVVFKRRKDKIIYHQNQLVLKNEKALAHAKLEKSRLQEEELKKEIQYKSKQLTTHALNMMQKNTLMQEIQEELVMISNKAASENKPVLNRIKMLIKKNLRSEKDWDLFKLYFEDVNKDFYDELGKLSPELTSNDIKLCALLKLNMNIKESASVLNIEPASVKTARYKLRKKFNLSPEEDLVEFIRKIG